MAIRLESKLQTWLTADDVTALDEIATREQTTRAAVARRLLRDALRIGDDRPDREADRAP